MVVFVIGITRITRIKHVCRFKYSRIHLQLRASRTYYGVCSQMNRDPSLGPRRYRRQLQRRGYRLCCVSLCRDSICRSGRANSSLYREITLSNWWYINGPRDSVEWWLIISPMITLIMTMTSWSLQITFCLSKLLATNILRSNGGHRPPRNEDLTRLVNLVTSRGNTNHSHSWMNYIWGVR